MHVYLPIAEMPVNILLIPALGAFVGLLSGIFGVGGGFLTTPMLMFLGIPAPVAVATGANQIVAASASGVLAHWQRGNVDWRMGAVLLAGGLAGSTGGVWLFGWLRSLGQIDLVIRLSYILFLGAIGGLMMVESLRAIYRSQHGAPRRKLHIHTWIHGLPFKIRFRRSRLYISIIPPLGIGLAVGVLSAIMGVGGGFVMIPAMIYLLGMPTAIVVGTSLLQAVVVAANVVFFQAFLNQTVDLVLALLLILGGVVGAQFGSRIGLKLRSEHLRGLLAVIVLAVWAKLAFDLVTQPGELYSIVRQAAGK